MRERTIQNLDWLFRHYVVFCLSISFGGFALGTVVAWFIGIEVRIEAVLWGLLGNTLGSVLCMLVASFLKARFNPGVIARLAMRGHSEKA
jgi:hypothetical protein